MLVLGLGRLVVALTLPFGGLSAALDFAVEVDLDGLLGLDYFLLEALGFDLPVIDDW
jgi:hypothetical protein